MKIRRISIRYNLSYFRLSRGILIQVTLNERRAPQKYLLLWHGYELEKKMDEPVNVSHSMRVCGSEGTAEVHHGFLA